MSRHKIFIDGLSGTTGLEIKKRLSERAEYEVLEIPEHLKKDPKIKKEYIDSAQVTILCLPDDAAKESVSLGGLSSRFLDASTAHRTNPNWVYGFPELKPDFRSKIKSAKYVANPGCYATGFIALVKPLIDMKILDPSYPFTVNAVSGYSGGGKSMIADYESKANEKSGTESLFHYAPYRLDLEHKHLPEMKTVCGLTTPPLFLPAVDHFYRGMLVTIPFHKNSLPSGITINTIAATLRNYYTDEPFITISQYPDFEKRGDSFLEPFGANETNNLDLFLFGTDKSSSEHLVLCARLDNLGKGASGAAVQNLNLMCGVEETNGLL